MAGIDASVIGFSGKIRSGKTSIANALGLELGWPRGSFGGFLKGVAQERGLQESRAVLQQLGDSLIAEGWAPFVKAVLSAAGWTPGKALILDGIRHLEAVAAIRECTHPLSFTLIHVQIEESIRLARFPSPEGVDRHALENHSSEFAVNALLPKVADFKVNGALPLQESVHQVVSFLRKKERAFTES